MSDVSALENGQKKMAQDRERGIQFSEDGTVLLKYPDGISDTVYEIPYGIKEIAQYAFADCGELKEVIITGSVMEIKAEAFNKKLNITSCNAKFKVDEQGVLIDIDLQRLIYAPASLSGEYVIPEGVVEIGKNAFFDCSGLTGVVISHNVEIIGEGAFYDCISLRSADISFCVTEIGRQAFCHCCALTRMDLPSTVTKIASGTFSSCFGLMYADIPDGVTAIGIGAFTGCSSLRRMVIPPSVTKIGAHAFFACTALARIVIPFRVTEIGGGAFFKVARVISNNERYKVDDKGVLIDTELQQLIYAPPAVSGAYVIPDGITKIGDHAFRSCNGVTGVTISESVTDIGDYAFCENTGLTDMSIPASVVRIGEGAFCGCSCLSELEILNSEVEIGRCAFNGCPRFNAPVVPDSVPEISEESAWNWSPGFSPVSITGDAAEKDEYGL